MNTTSVFICLHFSLDGSERKKGDKKRRKLLTYSINLYDDKEGANRCIERWKQAFLFFPSI